MHADALRRAVLRIVDILKRSEIRSALDGYRAARGDDRTVATARLGHAGAMLMERMESLSGAERQVARLMHLERLGATDYWQSLLDAAADPKERQREIVRLASRVMFATSHLPAFASLLETVPRPEASPVRFPLGEAEGRLVIRLSDAGERASDPDRVARSIDGIDMLYSACASIARKPAMDLRLEGVEGTLHRDLHFTGDREAVSAVVAVIESIPPALVDVDPDGDIDLEAIVASLPVFEDLRTLASLGTFSTKDLEDISETMQQGALLVLESGVVLIEQPASIAAAADDGPRPRSERTPAPSAVVGEDEAAVARGEAAAATPADDEHYERYLREREALSRGGGGNELDEEEAERRKRRDAVEELLRSLGQARDGS